MVKTTLLGIMPINNQTVARRFIDKASHKGDAGTYSVHLYYMLDGKRTYITETTATVPESQVTGKLTLPIKRLMALMLS